MSLEDKNETPESSVLEREKEQIPNKEIVRDASKFLEGIKTDSILALAEFSKQIETDRGTISKDTEHGKEALVKLDEVAEEKKQIEEELVDDIILWHGSGFSTITLENLSIDRNNEEMKEFLKYNGKASADPRYFGFYTTDSFENLKYEGISSYHSKEDEEKLEKEFEENKTFNIHEQSNGLQYYMISKKMSYIEAVKAVEDDWGESINPIFNEKEYSIDELSDIIKKTNFNTILREKLEKKYAPTGYRLVIDKNAKIGSPRDVPGFKSMIIKISEEDYKKARELGYDILVEGGEYVILNKDVVKKIDKSTKTKVVGIDENTGKETIRYVYPEFENQ